MTYLLAFLSAGLSFLLNRKSVERFGLWRSVTLAAPVLEEVLKTVPPFLLGGDIMLTHGLFGIIEGAYDWKTGGEGRSAAALLSLAMHSLLGGLTVAGLYYTGNLSLSLIPPIAAHIGWNRLIVKRRAGK